MRRRNLAIFALWVFVALYLAGAFVKLQARTRRWDFSLYYVASLMLRQGGNPYLQSVEPLGNKLGLETAPIVHAADTPTFLLCFEPLTLLRPAAAYWLWIALNFSFLAISIWMLVRGFSRRGALLLAALALLYIPTFNNFMAAQSQIIVLLLLLRMMRAMESGRDANAGLFLAAATLLRAYPILLAPYFLITKRWSVLRYLVLGLALGGLATLALVGWWRSLSFLVSLGRPDAGYRIAWSSYVSLDASLRRIFGVPRVVALTGEIAVLIATVSVSLREDADEERIFPLWIATMILLSPIAWIHFMILLMIPFVQIARDEVSAASWLAAASYVMIIMVAFRIEGGFLALILAYAATWWFAVQPAREVKVIASTVISAAAISA